MTFVADRREPWPGECEWVVSQARGALRTVLGEYGVRLSLVPLFAEPVTGIENAWLLTPDPDYEVGLVERVKVGDTEWGRCRIYVDPAVLHVVFDLDEETR